MSRGTMGRWKKWMLSSPSTSLARVINVLQQQLAILPLLHVDHMHGGARGAVMDAFSLHLHVVLGILAMQGEMPRRVLDRRQHQFARKADAPVVAIIGADARQRLDAAWNCVGEADCLQKGENRFVDAFEVVLVQRLVPATFQAGSYGADIVGQWSGARMARRASRPPERRERLS